MAMTAKNEVLIASKWIHSTVGTLGNTISGAYLDMIPKDVALPAVRYTIRFATDTMPIDGTRILVQLDWLVVVVREGFEVAPLVPIANALDGALHGATGTADGLRIDCTRVEPFGMIEPDDKTGTQYRHVGGIYRTVVGST
jgi:hypothetical protein